MITPAIASVVYVIAVIGVTLFALFSFTSNGFGALLIFVFGQLYVRVIFEFVMVLFRINENLEDINRRGRSM